MGREGDGLVWTEGWSSKRAGKSRAVRLSLSLRRSRDANDDRDDDDDDDAAAAGPGKHAGSTLAAHRDMQEARASRV